jgi:hypothetical protein
VRKTNNEYLSGMGGGLRIHDLEVKNRTLFAKWLFKLLTEHGV